MKVMIRVIILALVATSLFTAVAVSAAEGAPNTESRAASGHATSSLEALSKLKVSLTPKANAAKTTRTLASSTSSSTSCRWLPYTNYQAYGCVVAEGTYYHWRGGGSLGYFKTQTLYNRYNVYIGKFVWMWFSPAFSRWWDTDGCNAYDKYNRLDGGGCPEVWRPSTPADPYS